MIAKRLTALLLTLVLLGMTVPSWAEGLEGIQNPDLVKLIVTATRDEDQEELLKLMKEADRRALWFFDRKDGAICEADLPETSFFENNMLKQTFEVPLRAEAMKIAVEEAHCGCLYDLVDPAAFSETYFDKDIDQLNVADFRLVSSGYWEDKDQSERYESKNAYRAFRKAECSR